MKTNRDEVKCTCEKPTPTPSGRCFNCWHWIKIALIAELNKESKT